MKKTAIKALPVLIVAILLAIYPFLYYSSQETKTITVNRKERVTQTSGESIKSYYLIYTESGVYTNQDDWLYFKFDSSNVYNRLGKGETYRITVAGWRIPFFSWYENIIRVERSNKGANITE